LKVGTPITGFIREKQYEPDMLYCLQHPSPNAIPWDDISGNINLYQKIISKRPIPIVPQGATTLPLIKATGKQKNILQLLKTKPIID